MLFCSLPGLPEEERELLPLHDGLDGGPGGGASAIE